MIFVTNSQQHLTEANAENKYRRGIAILDGALGWRLRRRTHGECPMLTFDGTCARWLLAVVLTAWIVTFIAAREYATIHGSGPLNWDTGWYADIAARDYHFDGDITHQQPVAFLPAYPYTLRLLLAFGLPVHATVLLACIACAIGGTLLLFQALSVHLSPMISAVACVLLIASPFSLYFLNGYSESLYFLAMAAFWWALLRRCDDGLAALFAGLAGLVRPFGVLLALVWVADLFLRVRRRELMWRDAVLRIVALGPIAIAGPIIVCLYYAHRFDDLFLYRNIMVAWGVDVLGGGFPDIVDHLRVELSTLAEWHPWLIGTWPPELARLLFWTFLAIVPFVMRRIPVQLLLYGLGLIGFCLCTTESGGNLGRHLATNVALPIGLAVLLFPVSYPAIDEKRLWRGVLFAAIVIISLVAQLCYASIYFRAQWVS
jgi:hypothetical protein